MLLDHLETMQKVCFSREVSDADFSALGDTERWRIYRELVRSRFYELMHVAFDRTLETIGKDSLNQMITEWLDCAPPSERFFRALPDEFAAFALANLKLNQPPWLRDLMRYETARWHVGSVPEETRAIEEFSFEKPPALNPARALLELDYPVHEALDEKPAYEQSKTYLCVYRDSENKINTWTLNQSAYQLMLVWADSSQSAAQSIQALSTQGEFAIDEKFIEGLSGMLADFIERGIVLGSLS